VQAKRVLETCLYAENLAETADFYADILGLKEFARVDERHVFFRCGNTVLLLFNPSQTRQTTGPVPAHGAFGPGHVAFAMASHSVDAWLKHLQAHGVPVEAQVDWPSGGKSLYFRDPAGNSVELTTPKTWGADDLILDYDLDFRRMLNLLPVGVCLVEPETGEVLLANDSAACNLDIADARQLVGRSVMEFVGRRRRRAIRDYFQRVVVATAQPEFFLEHLELASGRQVHLEIASGYLNLAGRSVIQVAFRDITDRTQAEAALRESEELFRSLAETTDAAIFLFRGSHNIHVNAAACRITGYAYDELVTMPFWQVLHPDFRDLVRQRGLGRQQGEPVESSYEVAIVTKDGAIRWLQYAGNLIEYQGQPAVLGTAIDITARKEIEQALQESEARFRTLAHVSPASITVHVDNQIIYANPSACRLTGLSEEELRSADLWKLLQPVSLAAMQQAYELMQRGESVSDLKLHIKLKDGATRWLQVDWSQFDLRGRPAWIITAYDITALVEAEQALRRYARRIEILSEIDRLGLMAMSRQEIAALAVELIESLISCDQVVIAEADAARQFYRVLAASQSDDGGVQVGQRFRGESWESFQSPLAMGVLPTVDLSAVLRPTTVQKGLLRQGYRFSLAIPLTAQHRLLGTLTLAARRPETFDMETQTTVMEIARRLAMVLHNAHLFGELESSHSRLQELSRRLVQVQEAERRAIARELHDEVGQTLTALNIHLDLAARAGSRDQSQRLAETGRLVQELADRVRRMSLDLRPPMLDDLGLLPTLLWYFERITQQYQLRVAFEHHGIERRFDADIETALFRVVQEALTNVARHAGVSVVSVRLWADAATISAQIEDKGAGFDPKHVLSSVSSNGLRGMQERVSLLGGKLVIEAQTGSGACLTALLPMTRAHQS
jgi:PAS domain S-box-containing protein